MRPTENRMNARIVILLMIGLSACASTGVVPIGQGVYMLTKKSAACGFASAEGTMSDLYKEAGAYCATKGLEIATVEAIPRDGVPLVRCASAELHFKCVTPTQGQ
jgi:hypothetical protein